MIVEQWLSFAVFVRIEVNHLEYRWYVAG